MPYEPAPPAPTPRPRRRIRRTHNTILGVAAILCFLLSLFNLYMSYPIGIPPEFPLFITLSLIFTILWIFTRNVRGRGPGIRGR
jgi:ABC-type Mn2+/Zn2+ transport system permease subunit